MGLGPSQARELSYWEHSALLQTWNARHDPDGAQEPVEPPADGFVRERQARLAARGIAGRAAGMTAPVPGRRSRRGMRPERQDEP